MDEFHSKYEIGSEIGSGGFGRVYHGIRKFDRLPVAIKTVEREKVTEYRKVRFTVLNVFW